MASIEYTSSTPQMEDENTQNPLQNTTIINPQNPSNKLKTLCNTLASVGEPISSQEYLTYLLNGLRPEYNAFVTPILARPVKPTIEEVHAFLLSYEARLECQTATATLSSLQANFANLSFPKQRPKTPSQQPPFNLGNLRHK
ncbi:hypothetical protein G4B88_002606 [Cannabis sativa]|uniref:Uncharacterized protein n=1 Tax=Cannabis sativa TaxID=3483 RepID=A0A7J6I875_CANSA|nr:hypothetical protein G4B88_002606 [Cannabis sativa]